MALKDAWIDKVNEVDEINASDINNIAQAVIDLEDEPDIVADNAMSDVSENPVQNKVIKKYVDDRDYMLWNELEHKENKGAPSGYAPLDENAQIPDEHISNLSDRILNVETNKADISYVDNAISSAINEALEGDY